MGFHFFLTGLKDAAELDWDTLLDEVKQLAQPWNERLVQAIHEKFEASDAAAIERKYRDAFPSRYRGETSVSRAIQDIQLLESLDTRCTIHRRTLPRGRRQKSWFNSTSNLRRKTDDAFIDASSSR